MSSLTIHVIGIPVPQGSKVANSFGRGVRDTNATKLKPWRADVAGTAGDTARAAGWVTLDAPALVEITFYMPRLAGHYGTGRNVGRLKPSAPWWCSVKPDVDKLARAILDALTDAAVLRDDARVARLVVEKRYADAATGARITITTLSTTPAPSPVTPPPVAVAGEGHPTPEGLL